MSEKQESRNLKKNNAFASYLKGFIFKLAVIAAGVWILVTYVFGIFVCHDNDNYPSIKDGDLCITYKLDGYCVNDLISYKEEEKTHFGRIVGVEGDVIDRTEYGYTVNGVIPYESVFYNTELSENDKVSYPYTVKKDEVFVLADMRTDGKDTRDFGTISFKNIQGKIVLEVRRRGF